MRALNRFSRLLFVACLATTPAILVPWHAAHAQDADDAEAQQEAEDSAKKSEARKAAKRAAPPSALPGADGSDEDAGHARVDVNPTTALFDAINRGSLNAAKEALNRGADMGARNVLDQTPLDMAIDLNRNDIMFLLLSMRTYNPEGRLNTNLSDSGIDDSSGTPHMTIGGSATMVRPGKGGKSAKSTSPYDTRGGTPDTSIGFLGFGNR
ncbi:ankyrin repeat domain-containing protein [Neokomagataea tanensis]|uniref:Ankyrin repeat domain-containing protein n=2 Tax=Neokomagataea TaxID=1223423 RepID=A0A4Y6VB57_9PROT|nr:MULTISPECIES: ankyrin repeat domain-containing protein [Neokomagataea]QDH25756.1 ankyrin repeat domain-containing protein [Neokomagataea tanensis]